MVPVLYVVIQTLSERGLGLSHPEGFIAAFKEKAQWAASYLRVRKEIPPKPEEGG
jgi:hypothetical protein